MSLVCTSPRRGIKSGRTFEDQASCAKVSLERVKIWSRAEGEEEDGRVGDRAPTQDKDADAGTRVVAASRVWFDTGLRKTTARLAMNGWVSWGLVARKRPVRNRPVRKIGRGRRGGGRDGGPLTEFRRVHPSPSASSGQVLPLPLERPLRNPRLGARKTPHPNPLPQERD